MKIAIAGYGVEGKANYDYWSKDSSNDITIADESETPKFELPEGAKSILGPAAFEKLDGFDMVIRSAGLAPKKIKTDGKIWTATNEFFEKCQATIIGVTGTKGKGTTSTMINSILSAAGKRTHLLGNIGVAALGALDEIQPDDIVVFEMSSFQLWDLQRSPHIAAVLGIEPDHLNVHDDMEDYVRAKGSIRRYQKDGDICVYHPTNNYARQIAESNDKGETIRYAISDDGGVYSRDGQFMIGENVICPTNVVKVPGAHNIENACAAITVVLQIGISFEDIQKGLSDFEGLPHRLEKVRELNGVEYYNDSFSSAPPATVAAVNAFTKPEVLILGGIEKGVEYGELVRLLKSRGDVRAVILIGEVRHKLDEMIKNEGVDTKRIILDDVTMKDIVNVARENAQTGDVVILSPGSASFDMFKDFYDRGDQFREAVKSL